MNKKKLKIIKKAIYQNGSVSVSEYKRINETGQIIADLQRSVYQTLKKECNSMNKQQIAKHLKRS